MTPDSPSYASVAPSERWRLMSVGLRQLPRDHQSLGVRNLVLVINALCGAHVSQCEQQYSAPGYNQTHAPTRHWGRDSEQQLPPVCRVLVVTMVTCVAPEHWSRPRDLLSAGYQREERSDGGVE